MPNVQQEESAPKQEAPAAHAQTPATQEEGPWQEVKSSRRRPSSQHTASELGAHKAAKQSRDAPDQDDPPPPPPQPLRLQVAEQKQGQAQLPAHGTMHTDPRFTISSYEQVHSNCPHGKAHADLCMPVATRSCCLGAHSFLTVFSTLLGCMCGPGFCDISNPERTRDCKAYEGASVGCRLPKGAALRREMQLMMMMTCALCAGRGRRRSSSIPACIWSAPTPIR